MSICQHFCISFSQYSWPGHQGMYHLSKRRRLERVSMGKAGSYQRHVDTSECVQWHLQWHAVGSIPANQEFPSWNFLPPQVHSLSSFRQAILRLSFPPAMSEENTFTYLTEWIIVTSHQNNICEVLWSIKSCTEIIRTTEIIRSIIFTNQLYMTCYILVN